LQTPTLVAGIMPRVSREGCRRPSPGFGGSPPLVARPRPQTQQLARPVLTCISVVRWEACAWLIQMGSVELTAPLRGGATHSFVQALVCRQEAV